jgi:Putative DNA-binding domain
MPLMSDQIRALAAQGESDVLDFKRDDYNWTIRQSNAELAKDLMAIANLIDAKSPPAYILIGVDNAGTIVGVTEHLDDAVLHQKVAGLLNLTPTFAYYPVQVDGKSIGVYEITGGQRPYYPVGDSAPSLRRNVAMFRNGSSTDVAAPPLILSWAREDDPDGERRRALQLRQQEAEARVVGRLSHTWVNDTPKGMSIGLRVENNGIRSFTIQRCRWRAEWNWSFSEALNQAGVTLPANYVPPSGDDAFDEPVIVKPDRKYDFSFGWSRDKGLEHLKAANIALQGFSASWANYHFEIPCNGELGEEKTLALVARPLG